MDYSYRLSPHFTLGEMTRSQTASRNDIDNTPPDELMPKLILLCENILEPVRNHFGIPFSPSSGFRSVELNKAIGGSENSQHCKGEAVDLELPGISNYDLAAWIEANLEFDQLILECYVQGQPASGWVHVSLKDDVSNNRKLALTYTNRAYLPGLVA